MTHPKYSQEDTGDRLIDMKCTHCGYEEKMPTWCYGEEADAVFQKAKDENLYAEQDKKYSSAFVPINLKRFIDDTSNERGLGKAEILTIIIWHFLKEKRLEL